MDEALNTEPVPEPAGNFRITDDDLGVGGPKQKYARNVEAIRTLFKLEDEHRGATAEEQQVLSQYVGWGGLADAFDPDKDNWAKEYAELKGLLSGDEYTAARSSTLNAHYTSPTVIRGIYDAVEKMGFQSGNILEPSMGVGNFFGMLPTSMADSRLYGVELDSITGRIAKKLYPQADITVAGFETIDRRDFYDLAVGNVPFGQYKVNDKAYNKLGFSIHNYFFAKAIDQVRPGGVVAFVTSRYTMDSKDIEIILNVPLEEFEEFKSHSLSVRTPSGRKTNPKQAPVRGLGTPNGGIVVFDKTSGEAMNIMPKSSAHVTLRCQDE